MLGTVLVVVVVIVRVDIFSLFLFNSLSYYAVLCFYFMAETRTH